jgi:hypothetical protein
MYYCIAIKNRGIMHRFGNPVLFGTENDAKWFLCSDEVLKWQDVTGISQTDLSVQRVVLNSYGW